LFLRRILNKMRGFAAWCSGRPENKSRTSHKLTQGSLRWPS
jgi:hypothetical protein